VNFDIIVVCQIAVEKKSVFGKKVDLRYRLIEQLVAISMTQQMLKYVDLFIAHLTS
jgi:hypothetical protein